MIIKLHQLDNTLKKLLTAYVLVLTIGMGIGIVFLMKSTNASAEGTIERWNGSKESEDQFFVQENYAKPIDEMLITTHNHIFGFAFIFISIGLIFYFNSTISGFWKSFLLVEPLVSTVVTFGSIWLMRFVSEKFVYLTVVSAILLYASYFVMFIICFYELNVKKS